MRSTIAIGTLLLAILLPTAAPAQEYERQPPYPDWSFGCHKAYIHLPKTEQPCWMQSRTVHFLDKEKRPGSLYFQVHLFVEKSVLRVHLKGREATWLRPTIDLDDGYREVMEEMTKMECKPDSCWGERVSPTEELGLLASGKVTYLGLHWKSPSMAHSESTGLGRALTMRGFAESFDELRQHVAAAQTEK